MQRQDAKLQISKQPKRVGFSASQQWETPLEKERRHGVIGVFPFCWAVGIVDSGWCGDQLAVTGIGRPSMEAQEVFASAIATAQHNI